MTAWINGALVWGQLRSSEVWERTPLLRDVEFGYQTVRLGEGVLRDVLASLYDHT